MSEFAGAGKKEGLEAWRIEKLLPAKMPDFAGKLYTGDSYIILKTTASSSGALSHAIHFWLGAETSQDESGIAAYKTIELDDSLGGGPVQYREVQGNESQLFLSYFKKTGGIEYLPGGVESGFRKVERDVYETRLLHVKGKRTVRVSEVPLSGASLNKGDVFILDAGLKIYIFNGPEANKYEKAKGIDAANKINVDERSGKAKLVIVNDDIKNEEFWGPLGGFKDPASLPEGESDDSVVVPKFTPKMFRISDSSGSIEFGEISSASGKLERTMLESDDVFLVHAPGKVYLWIGRKANMTEKKEATARAVEYIAKNGLPKNTAVERVSEGTESASFKSVFAVWDRPMAFNRNQSVGVAHVEQYNMTSDDIAAMVARKKAEETPIDDGSGKLQVWVIKDFQKEEVAPVEYGQFYGGDSYILLYSYMKGRSQEYIIYFWLGNDSSLDEKGAAALLAVELDDSLGGKPVQVRVTQGKEPNHFRQLFKGKMIVYKGGNASGFKNTDASAKSAAPTGMEDVGLFHVKGTSDLNTCAVQVPTVATALNSEDCFVLVTPESVFAWCGVGANADEHAVATNVATILAGKYNGKGGRAVVEVKEGSEPQEFWSALGGKADYPSMAPGEAPPKDPRLFSASTATGTFKVEEIDNYDQSDLNDEDVFLLDTFTQLFVWIGSQSTQQEKDQALDFAKKYIESAQDGRDVDMPVVRVFAGKEPPMFSCHFLGWDPEYTEKQIFHDPYEARLQQLSLQRQASVEMEPSIAVNLRKTNSFITKPAATPAAAVPELSSSSMASSSMDYADPKATKFALDELKGGLPAGVDPTKKEAYLEDAVFSSTFGMDHAAFSAMPKWKRDAAKQKFGLF